MNDIVTELLCNVKKKVKVIATKQLIKNLL